MCEDRIIFCKCAFMDKVFILGGCNDRASTFSCLQFATSNNSWKEVVRMNEARSRAVFEERIVVSGGIGNNNNVLKIVESFDVLPDKWSSMPNMNFAKCSHSLVGVKNI